MTLPASFQDQMVQIIAEFGASGYVRMVLRFPDRLAEAVLSRAVRRLYDAEPVLACTFDARARPPRWRRRDDLDALAEVEVVPAEVEAPALERLQAEPCPAEAPPKINLTVTVPREEINQAALQQCRDENDAGTLSGEIVVCGATGNDTSALTGDRAATQKRYAQETMLKGAPRAPEAFGIPNHGNPIGFGGVPPPAVFIDVEALPKAPPGSDADRIARGLAPLDQDRELTEEEEKARREALGIKTTAPPRDKKKGG